MEGVPIHLVAYSSRVFNAHQTEEWWWLGESKGPKNRVVLLDNRGRSMRAMASLVLVTERTMGVPPW